MPKMMAIGDSLFNGVRSLTINESLAQWSVPAQVARALNIPFTLPDYPRNVVMNVEQWLREFPNVGAIGSDVASNIAFWDKMPASSLKEFDNIAIASTKYAHMSSLTWKQADDALTRLKENLGKDFTQVGGHLKDLFFAFNTRFLLNPTSNRDAPEQTPLEIVAARKPCRLLVSIGGNNGLWSMGFASRAATGTLPGGALPDGPFNDNDLNQLDDFAKKICNLPEEVRHIYWITLPLPSMLADMMPTTGIPRQKPGPGSYYRLYENEVGFNYGTLTCEQMSKNDNTVRALNARMVELANHDQRIHMVRIDALFTEYDFKTNPNAATVPISDYKVLSNIMLEGPDFFFPNHWSGGLMGLDGMHPTFVGYALMARAILQSIHDNEHIEIHEMPDLELACRADTLLQKVPHCWDLVLRLSLDIRRARASGQKTPSDSRYDAVSEFLKALSFRYD